MPIANDGSDTGIEFGRALSLVREADKNPPKNDLHLYIEWMLRHCYKHNQLILCLVDEFGYKVLEAEKIIADHHELYS